MSKYVCQTSAFECSKNPIAVGMANYDFGKDEIGTGGDQAVNVWASVGDGSSADEIDLTFTDAHVTPTAIGPVNWQWSLGYDWFSNKHGYLLENKDDVGTFDLQVGQSYTLGTIAGVKITTSPFGHFLYWRGFGMNADVDDIGINVPIMLHFTKRLYGTFEVARLWSLSRHYPSPLQMTSTLGYRFADHWAVYVKYRGVKAHSQYPQGDYINMAAYGAGISFTGL